MDAAATTDADRIAAPTGAAPPSLGPVLRFRGGGEGRVRLSVTAACAGPGMRPLGALAGTSFHGVDLDLAAAPDGTAALPPDLAAAFPTLPARVALPRQDGSLRVAFASCNGAEDETTFEALPGGRDGLWRRLAARHVEDPLHLLVLGGDQIYADAVWDLPSIAAWRALPRGARLAAPWTDAMRRDAEAHYRDTYARAFGSPTVAAMLAAVPSVMVWDDHDIVDGWGSRSPAWQAAPVAQGLFATARRAYALIQQGIDPDAAPPPASGYADAAAGIAWSGDHGPARIVVPDLRSGRTRRRVMTAAGHAHLARAVAGHDRPHVVVVSSVPLVNADLSAVERVVTPLMPVADLYQDDLRDQWASHAHRAERRAAMAPLFDAASRARVSVLSGEIHLGAHGIARLDGRTVEQFIASGIAHPPPPRVLARLHEAFARRLRNRHGMALAMRPILPDGRRYLAERNWLEATFHPDGTRDATIHGERTGPIALAEPPPG